MHSKTDIDERKLPRHVAIIMDGNGRWAKKRGNMRIFGHRSAIKAVRDVTEGAAELGISFLTLYAFSTENWNRPKHEVNALMELLVDTLRKELPTLMDNDIRLRAIGHTENLPGRCASRLQEVMDRTASNQRMTLTLALSYGSRSDITQAMRLIAEKVQAGQLAAEEIDQETIQAHLSTAEIPDPELLIRTSGEYRVSNFLLWEIAYTELYVTSTLWPDFRREDLYAALVDYQQRERRFGKISEQIKNHS
jgi:undecaprenyl diphosphate synthase